MLASAEADAPALAFADRAVRQLLPLALDASALAAAAQSVRALSPAVDDASVRRMMFSLEKVARAHAAPELLIRAAHGVCACALSLLLAQARGPDAVERAQGQLGSALVRLVTTAVKGKVPLDAAVRCLASAGNA